jgi:transcriptional regulator with XRE-family HTH domain
VILTEDEYSATRDRLALGQAEIERERQTLAGRGLTPLEVDRLLAPLQSFGAQIGEELAEYEALRRGEIQAVPPAGELGRLLIELRIANGLSQGDLARRLGRSEAELARDEQNEYYGLAPEAAQRILDVLVEATAPPRPHWQPLFPLVPAAAFGWLDRPERRKGRRQGHQAEVAGRDWLLRRVAVSTDADLCLVELHLTDRAGQPVSAVEIELVLTGQTAPRRDRTDQAGLVRFAGVPEVSLTTAIVRVNFAAGLVPGGW